MSQQIAGWRDCGSVKCILIMQNRLMATLNYLNTSSWLLTMSEVRCRLNKHQRILYLHEMHMDQMILDT